MHVKEIRLKKDKANLVVTFEDDVIYQFTAEFLRVLSPSAEVQGHGPEQKKLVLGKEKVTIKAIEPIGHYAIKLVFSDGHDTGFYTWNHLYDMGKNQEALWASYLKECKEKASLTS